MPGVFLVVLLLAAGLGFADWTITNRLPFDPNMREPEFEWLESDPNLYVSLFETYRQFEGRPYLWLIAENWLEYNPILKRTVLIGGRPGFVAGRGFRGRGTRIPPLCLGNLNGDDAIDLGDFAIAAAYQEAWRYGTSEGLSSGGELRLYGRGVGVHPGSSGLAGPDGQAVSGDLGLSGDCKGDGLCGTCRGLPCMMCGEPDAKTITILHGGTVHRWHSI